MNPGLNNLQPYPFQRMRALFGDAVPNESYAPINLSIGEPKHPTPDLIKNALISELDKLANYPLTKGSDELRNAIAGYLTTRYQLGTINSDSQILPVNGTREALFAIAQCLVEKEAAVLMPNPFYQIYEGAALLAGAQAVYLNTTRENGFLPDIENVSKEQWQQCQLIYLCSPGNPSGTVAPAPLLKRLIELSDLYDFTIVADECYAEIYPTNGTPPVGLLEVAQSIGRSDFRNCLVFHSLSKRSNAPGLRSGFVAGDAKLINSFLQYRTYHGSAMSPPSQHASAIAWQDNAHVIENRRLYTEKFAAVIDILKHDINIVEPDAGFYLWLNLDNRPGDSRSSNKDWQRSDTQFAKQLYQQYNVTVLPGSYLSRKSDGVNPGCGFIRVALVADLEQCVDAAKRIRDCIKQ
ncbi:MAG: succinyldiaminopimelate transaminase [Gammaproteobacteria bacterium]|nr:succinyldiaminopimelate transaminase [Gammaproteobacteria bacterium]